MKMLTDDAGNISSPSLHRLIVDNTGPAVSISQPNITSVKGDSAVEYLLTFADDADIESINSLFDKSKISFESTGTANAVIGIETVSGNDRQRKIKLSDFSGDGSISNLIIAPDICRDSAGNASLQISGGTHVTVDNTVPAAPYIEFTKLNGDALSRVLNFVTFGYFWKEEILATIHSEDNGGSGLSKIYLRTDESQPYSGLIPDVNGNVTLTLPVGFKGNVWAYSEDGSGNTSAAVKSDGAVSENSAPVISVSPSDPDAWYVNDVTVNVTVTDDQGIAEIRYSVDGVSNVIDMAGGYTDGQKAKALPYR
jgi:hypothetical protein